MHNLEAYNTRATSSCLDRGVEMCSGNIHSSNAAPGISASTKMDRALADDEEEGGRLIRDQQPKTSRSTIIEVIPTTVEVIERRSSGGKQRSKSSDGKQPRRRASSSAQFAASSKPKRTNTGSTTRPTRTVPRFVDIGVISNTSSSSHETDNGGGDGGCGDNDDDDVSSLGEPSAIFDIPVALAPTTAQAHTGSRHASSNPISRKQTRSSTLTSSRTLNHNTAVESNRLKPNLVVKNNGHYHNHRHQRTDLEAEQQRSRKLASVLKETRKMAEAAVSEVKRLQERNCALTTRLEEKTLEASKLTERIQSSDDGIDRHHRAQRRMSLDSSIVAEQLDRTTSQKNTCIDVSTQLLDDLRNDLIAMERRLELERKKRAECSIVEAELRNRIILLETENLALKKYRDLPLAQQLEDPAVALSVPSDGDVVDRKKSFLDLLDDTKSMASRSMRNLYQGLLEEEKASTPTLATTGTSTSRSRSSSWPINSDDPSFKSHPWKDGAEKEPSDDVISEDHKQEPICTEDTDLLPAPASIGQEWTAKLNDKEAPASSRRRDSERSLSGSTDRPGSSLGSIFENDIYDDDDISLDVNDTLLGELEEKARSRLRDDYFQDECHTSIQSLPAVIIHAEPNANESKSNKILMHRSFSSSRRSQYEKESVLGSNAEPGAGSSGTRRRSGSFGSLGNISIGAKESRTRAALPSRRSSSET